MVYQDWPVRGRPHWGRPRVDPGAVNVGTTVTQHPYNPQVPVEGRGPDGRAPVADGCRVEVGTVVGKVLYHSQVPVETSSPERRPSVRGGRVHIGAVVHLYIKWGLLLSLYWIRDVFWSGPPAPVGAESKTHLKSRKIMASF